MLPKLELLPSNYKLKPDEETSNDRAFIAYWWAKEGALPVGIIHDNSKRQKVAYVLAGHRWSARALEWSWLRQSYRSFLSAYEDIQEIERDTVGSRATENVDTTTGA